MVLAAQAAQHHRDVVSCSFVQGATSNKECVSVTRVDGDTASDTASVRATGGGFPGTGSGARSHRHGGKKTERATSIHVVPPPLRQLPLLTLLRAYSEEACARLWPPPVVPVPR